MGLTRAEAERLGLGHLFPPKGGKGRRGPVHERFVPNRTERRYLDHLEVERLAGNIKAWEFERDTFCLAPDMTYTPDVRIEELDGTFSFVDVKRGGGWTHDDSVCKGKAAAALFPQHRFSIATWRAPRVMKRGEFVAGHWDVRRLGVAMGKQGGAAEAAANSGGGDGQEADRRG